MYFSLDAEKVKKLNMLLPKGYKLITPQQLKKKQALRPKKKLPLLLPPTTFPTSQPFQPTQTKLPTFSQTKMQPPKVVPKPIVYQPHKPVISQPPKVIPPIKPITHPNIVPKAPPIINIPEIKSNPSIANLPPVVPKKKTLVLTQPKNNYQRMLFKLNQHPKSFEISCFDESQGVDPTFAKIYQRTGENNYNLNQLSIIVERLFLKAYQVYPKTSEEYSNTVQLQSHFKKLMDDQKNQEIRQQQQQQQQQSSMMMQARGVNGQQNNRKRTLNRIYPGAADGGISIHEKRVLGQSIKKLPSQYLQGIVRIVFDTRENKDFYEFDIDTLPRKKVRQLQDYVHTCNNGVDGVPSESKLDKGEDSNEESSFVIYDDEQTD